MVLAQVTVQGTENPNVRAYHTRFEMSSSPECGIRGGNNDLGAFGEIVLAIRGVVTVQVMPYVLLVTKALLFDWPEIDVEVQKILIEFAKSQNQLEEAVRAAGSRTRV